MSDGNPQLVAALQGALDSLKPRHTLMVIPQPAELRQYLQDSLRAARSPAALVLNISDPVIEALVAWIRAQRDAIAPLQIGVIRRGNVFQSDIRSLDLAGTLGNELGHLPCIAGVGVIEHEDLGHRRGLSVLQCEAMELEPTIL